MFAHLVFLSYFIVLCCSMVSVCGDAPVNVLKNVDRYLHNGYGGNHTLSKRYLETVQAVNEFTSAEITLLAYASNESDGVLKEDKNDRPQIRYKKISDDQMTRVALSYDIDFANLIKKSVIA